MRLWSQPKATRSTSGHESKEMGPTMPANLTLEEAIALRGADRDSPYRTMLLDFIEKQAQYLAAGLPEPKTRDAWLRRIGELRSRLLHSLGLDRLPRSTRLEVQTLGTIERSGYAIQKLVYECLPGFAVTAHLYLPRHAAAPAPAVLYSPGHWMENCKLEPDIQVCCANLARLGFVVLVYDPIGQGERLGDWLDHGHLEPLLVGLSQEGLMVWESMRAIDYLVSHPQVDPQRIGMTGASGGGLNTLYTSAVDERIQVSVPVCYVNTFFLMMTAERDRNWEDGVDLCNQVPGVMAYAEMSDICGLFAPKPLCVIASIRDWMFPIEGVHQVYKNVERIYELLDVADRVHLVEVDAEHGYDREMRQAAYGWLARWLKDQGDGSPIPEFEPDLLPIPYHPALTYIAPPDPAHLPILRRRASFPITSPGLCFPEGASSPSGPAITALVGRIAESLPPVQSQPADADDWDRQRLDLLHRVRTVLGPFPDRTLVSDRIFNQSLYNGFFFERVVFESEPGVEIPAMFVAPAEWKAYVPAIVYVDEWGKEAGLSNGTIRALLEARFAVLAIDVRGVGETATTDFEAATNALMTDRPLFGQRVWDLLRAVDCLWGRTYISVQIDKGRIACLGRGVGGLLALYAAALDERISATVVQGVPLSYKDLILERPGFPPSVFAFDVLSHFDLAHVAGLVAPRPLLVVDGVNGARQPVTLAKMQESYAWCKGVYTLLGAEGRFASISTANATTLDCIVHWLDDALKPAR